MKYAFFLLLLLFFAFQPKAQPTNCEFKESLITINFGSGNVDDANAALSDYEPVFSSCPTDGHYTYTDYTSNCFRGDWLTLTEDHTPGDISGNMMLVNSSYNPGTFFRTALKGLKSGTTYEFGVWLMNVCRISDKCPFPLLPNITIQLQTVAGKTVAQFGTGEVARREAPHWTQYRAIFTAPSTQSDLTLIMINNKPGGCGNDFALDDITIRECVKRPLVVRNIPKTIVVAKKQPAIKPVTKKVLPVPVKTRPGIVPIAKPQKDSQVNSTSV